MTMQKNKRAAPVEPEEGVSDLLKLAPLKACHLGVMAVVVVVASPGLGILISCAHAAGQDLWHPDRLDSTPEADCGHALLDAGCAPPASIAVSGRSLPGGAPAAFWPDFGRHVIACLTRSM